MSVILKPDPLNTLHNQVAAQAYDFYHALALCAEAPNDTLAQPIENCQKYIATIQQSAQTAQLSGLTQLCEHLLEKIASLRDLDAEQRFKLCSEIEHLPLSISNYLYAPIDSTVCRQLANCVHDAASPGLLEVLLDDAKHLQKTVSSATEQPEAVAQKTVETTETVAPIIHQEQSVVHSKLTEIPQSVIQLPETAISEFSEQPITELKAEIADEPAVKSVAVAELEHSKLALSAGMELKDDSAVVDDQMIEPAASEEFTAVESAESPGAMTFETEELAKLLDEEIFDNIPDAPVTDSVVFSDELTELDEEFELEDTLLKNLDEETEEELAALEEMNVAAPLSAERVESPKAQLPTELPRSMYSRRDESLDDLSNKIVEVSDILASALHLLMTAENDSEAFLTAVEEYTNIIQMLWERAEKARLSGLQRVCTFINDNVFELSALSQQERFKYFDLFSAAPQSMLNYVQDSRTGTAVLVEYLAKTEWFLPFPADQLSSLAVQLRQEAIILQIEQPDHIKRVEASSEQLKLQEANAAQLTEVAENAQIESAVTEAIKAQSEPVLAEIPKEILEHDEFIFSDEMPEDEESFLVKERLGFEVALATLQPLEEKDESPAQLISEEIIEPILISPILETTDTFLHPVDGTEEIVTLAEMPELADVTVAELAEDHFAEPLPAPPEFTEIPELLGESLVDELLEDTLEFETAATPEFDEVEEYHAPATILESQQADEWIEESPVVELLEITSDAPLISADGLDNLQNELAEAMDDLHQALHKFATVDNDSPELLEAVEQYTDNIQSIADAADNVGLQGLAEVCAFVNENMYELSTQPRAVRRAAQSHLAEWNRLVQAYVSQPRTITPQLIHHLSDMTWPFPLESERAAELSERLLHLHTPDIVVTESPLPEVPEVESVELIEEADIILAPPVVLHRLQRQLTQAHHALSAALVKVSNAEDSSEDLLMAVGEYTEAVQTVWDAAEVAGLKGLQDICSIINDNVMAMSAEAQPTRLAVQQLFADWIQHAEFYLQQPSVGAVHLISHLQNPAWLLPPSHEQLAELHESLLTPSNKTETSPAPLEPVPESVTPTVVELMTEPVIEPETVEPEIVLAATDILAVLEGQLIDSGEQLTEILTRLLNAKDGSEELLMIVGEYNEAVQAVWDTADMAHLVGLQEVCTFINDNVMLLGTQDKTVRLAAQDLFNHWIPLASNYLQHPRAGAEQLSQHLQNPLWAAPLSSAQAEKLRHLLLQQPETAIETIPTSESISESLSAVVAEEDFSLAAPEVIELLQGQVQDTAQQLNEILQRLVDADDGNEDLLLAVGEYTEAVQAIWDAADMAQLTGLQEVCGFINDNVMAFGMQDKATRTTTQVLFVQWLEAVSLYLRSPRAGAQNLFNLLQSPQWVNPLDNTQAKTLEQKLTQSGKITLPVPEEQQIVLAAPEVLDVVRNQITDLIEGLSSALEVCISMQNDNPALLEAVENYTNQVQAIYEAAEMAGLAGLQDVCVFINDNLMVLSAQEQQQKLAAQSLFQQFPHQVLGYLSIPHSGAPQLVKFLQHPDWATPLASETAPELLQKLLQSSTSDTLVAAYEQQVEAEQLAVEIEEEIEAESEELDVEVDGSQQISLGSAEVLEILTTELAGIKDELTAHLEKYTTLNNNQPGFNEAAENYADNIGRLAMATEMVGLTGLQQLCQLLIENVQLLAQKDLAARVKAKKLLEAWPDLILAYLNAPMEHVIALLNHFRESQWAKPLPDEQAHELLGKLTASTEQPEEDEADAYQRQTLAKPEDVVLNVPPDINRDLLEAYLIEVPQHAQEFSQCVQNIIRAPDAGEIQKAKRIAHTLKGSSRIIGIEGVANMGHHLEDILEYFTSHQDVTPPKELTDMMVEAADCIETMVDSLLGQADPPENSLYVLQSVLDWANKIDKGNLQGGATTPRPATPAPAAAPKADTGGGAKAEEKAPAGAPITPGDATPEQVLRVPTKTVDNLLRLVGELSISIGQIQERLKHVMGSTRLLGDHSMVLQKKTFELENLVDVRGITGVDYSESREGGEFDSLEFEEYNELHSVAHSFIESIADTRELGTSIRNDLAELETMFIQHERLNRELQANIMTTRMVPVNTIISKLQRNIRQTCRMTNKQAELVVHGADIMMDSDVLNNLGDPLMHLLRNSIDHGLESPDERVMLGKPAEGTVTLSFYREGNNIVVSCKDDGQGLNYTNIRYKAIEKGLLRENQEVSDAELARMILMSGFSTKSGVTQVSGRGVGMDVVHTNIRNMKGTLDIVSETGKGSNFIIKLPMTLVTVHVLIARIGQYRYGIPTNTIEQALVHGAGEFQMIGNELTMKMGKRTFAVKALSDLLNVAADKPGIEDYNLRPVVLVREETGTVAVIIDELVDTHDLVMKSMGKFVQKVRGVVGASILGDGHLIPLLDLPELLRSPMQALIMSSAPSGDAAVILGAGPRVPNILVVDDSLSVRKSMSLLLEEQGFEVLLAKDGLEAIEVLNQIKPDIMLVDMEMPRMNGLELTAHARANAATSRVPIFMITSRTTEKHREQAKAAGVSHYLTKPYQDTELLALIDKGLTGGFN